MDQRYRAKYGMSMMENLACIRDNGVRTFLMQQSRQYMCPTCGGTICVHRGRCLQCGAVRDFN